MRAAAALFLASLAALASVYVIAIATDSPKPAAPGEAHSLVWGNRVFTSKREFAAWLDRRNVSYADWVERHPGAAPWEDDVSRALALRHPDAAPREDDGGGSGVLALLAAAFAAILALLVRARHPVMGFARGGLLGALGHRRSEEMLRPVAAGDPAFSLRTAVSGYRLHEPSASEPRQEPERQEPVLVEPSHAASVVAGEFDREAVATDPLPDPPASAAPPTQQAVVETAPRSESDPVRPEPESASPIATGASDPEPEASAAGSKSPQERVPEATACVEAAPVEEPGRRQPEPRVAATGVESEPEAVAVETPLDPSAAGSAPAPEAAVVTAPRGEPAPVDSVRPEPESARPVAAAAVDPEREASGAGTSAEETAVETTPRVAPAPAKEPVPRESDSRPAVSPGAYESESEHASPADRETALPRPVDERAPIDRFQVQALAPESAPVVCEVALWRGYVSAQFYARIRGDDELSAIATSPMFRCRSAMPEQTEECLAALAALTDQLVAEGWKPNGGGRAWYAGRFTHDLAV